MNCIEIVTSSPGQTKAMAEEIGKNATHGLFFALSGPMGAGKTTFTQGLVDGIGFEGEKTAVTSPTYAIVHELPARIPVYHIDMFRLSSAEEIDDLGYRDFLESGAIVVVEWAEKFIDELPKSFIHVKISMCENASGREVTIESQGKESEIFMQKLLKNTKFDKQIRR